MKPVIRRAAILLVLLAVPASGKFAPRETQDVPVPRLLKNLEAQHQADPKNTGVILAMARVHSMAAARGDSFSVEADSRAIATSYGQVVHPDPVMSYFFRAEALDGERSRDVGKDAAARAHLDRAIALYREGLGMGGEPKDRLGLAWCEEQRGDKQQAIDDYRRVLREAFPIETDVRDETISPYRPLVSQEAASGLQRLLDATKDRVELDDMREKQAKIHRKRARWITPILVETAPGLPFSALVNEASPVRFDLDGSGVACRWGWPTAKAAMLVYDPARRREITSGLQLFGSVTFWIFWGSGYDALAALDDDQDGSLRGAELDGLALWLDENGDGISQPDEVKTLSESGISAISTRAETDLSSGLLRGSVTFRDGRTLATYDWVPRCAEPLPPVASATR